MTSRWLCNLFRWPWLGVVTGTGGCSREMRRGRGWPCWARGVREVDTGTEEILAEVDISGKDSKSEKQQDNETNI